MKKIYYLLCLLPLMPLVSSCDDEEAEVVLLQNPESQPVTLSSIAPDYGFVGDQFTLTGTNFGGGVDFIQVFIGENEAEVLTCTDTEVKVLVPKEATTGRISVRFMGQEVNSDLMFRVMGKPSVEQMKPLFGMEGAQKAWGFVGSEITFSGSELGGSQEDVKVIFKGATNTPAEIVSWSEEEFKVKVPEGAVSGKLTLTVGSQTLNTPYEFRLVEHAAVSGITPQQGYKGCEVTISGKSLGDETTKGQTKVWFGDKAGTVLSCENEKITVKVPGDLTIGQSYDVKLSTAFETVEQMLKFKVVEEPKDFTGDIQSGYLANPITLSGTNMPATADALKVMFGDKEGKILEYKDGSLQVEIPSNASIGKVKLSLIDAGVEFVVNDKFEIKAAPVIEYCDVAVFAGETMKITGANLSALPVTVMIGNQQVSSTPSVSDTEITFTVPANLSGDVKVILNFGENVRPAECEVTVLPAQTGDITNYVLENTSSPFAIEGNGLKGWNTNSIFYGNPYVEKDGNVWMALNGKNNTWNGALFQSTTLPKGKYRFSITVADVDAGTNRNVVLFAVMEGKDTPFPGISDDPKPGHFISQDKLLGVMNIKDQPNPVVATHSFEMTMDKSLPVTIGFATMLGDTRYLYISEIKVEHIE
jgi:hypothetical protein